MLIVAKVSCCSTTDKMHLWKNLISACKLFLKYFLAFPSNTCPAMSTSPNKPWCGDAEQWIALFGKWELAAFQRHKYADTKYKCKYSLVCQTRRCLFLGRLWFPLMLMVRCVTFVHMDLLPDKYFHSSKGEIHLKILQPIPWEPMSIAEIVNKVGAGAMPSMQPDLS